MLRYNGNMQQFVYGQTKDSDHAVDDYIASLPDAEQAAVQRVYDMARKLVPDVKQAVYYGMPCLKYKDKGLVSVVVAKKFLSLYPYSNLEAVIGADQLDGFETTKGGIHFSTDRPLSDTLLRQIILGRKQRIDKV